MCLKLSRTFFSELLMVAILLLFAVGEGYGQRVYADVQQSSPNILLSEVTNQGFSIDLDTMNHSTLSVRLGLIGLISANQNLQFANNLKPMVNSPVMIKFSSSSSLLSLLGGFSVQRTNGGRTSPVNPSYGGNELLYLLNLLGGNETAIAIVPPNGQAFDGIRLEINTTLGIAMSANCYYAFFIVDPTIKSIELCSGAPSSIIISNFQSGYTYKIYNSEIGGDEMSAMETNTNSVPVPSSLDIGVHEYWLEARESNLYPSARTRFTVTVYSKPGSPHIEVQ